MHTLSFTVWNIHLNFTFIKEQCAIGILQLQILDGMACQWEASDIIVIVIIISTPSLAALALTDGVILICCAVD